MRPSVRSWLHPKWRSFRSLSTSIRFQVTLGIWLILVASIAAEQGLLWVYAVPRLHKVVHQQLIQESRFYDAWVQSWEHSMKAQLQAAAKAPSLRNGLMEDYRKYMESLIETYPFYHWRLFNNKGDLLIYTGQSPDQSLLRTTRSNKSDFVSQAMTSGYQFKILYSANHKDDCMGLASPWHEAGKPNTPAGVLLLCVPLNKIGSAAELSFLASRLNRHNTFMPRRGNLSGRAFLLIDNDGSLLLPSASMLNSNALETPAEVAQGPWDEVVQQARRVPQGQDSFFTSTVNNVPVLVYVSNPKSTQWMTINLIDQASAEKNLLSQMRIAMFIQLVMLTLSPALVFLFSTRLVEPVRQAALGLRQLRSGQFNVNLPVARADEFGQLLSDINDTAAELGRLMASRTQLALQTQQLDTAYSIQQSFLLRRLPQGPSWQLHACTTPALQIGADWYDAFVHENRLFILVADVCDKGVGSALFMSVFRSLVRYGWQHLCANPDLSSEEIIVDSITVVNHYMCENHAEASMFATVFAAVYDVDTGRLTYVNAGHESPFVLSESGLKELPVTGPAVGIFDAARFMAASLTLLPGESLFAYSDGLTDARSASGEPFGKTRVGELLQSMEMTAIDAQRLVEHVQIAVSEHSAEAEPFDDLTLLCLHLQPLHKPPSA